MFNGREIDMLRRVQQDAQLREIDDELTREAERLGENPQDYKIRIILGITLHLSDQHSGGRGIVRRWAVVGGTFAGAAVYGIARAIGI